MTAKTAISVAFGRHGVSPEDAAFDVAIARYLNAGGTIERAQERLRLAAEKLPGRGQTKNVSNDRTHFSLSRQPVEGEKGHSPDAHKGRTAIVLPPSPAREVGGHSTCARDGQSVNASPPRATDRGISMKVLAATAKVATTALDRHKTIDGRAWGDVGAHELTGMHRDGALAKAIADFLGPLSGDMRFKSVRHLMTEQQFTDVLDRVRGANYVAA